MSARPTVGDSERAAGARRVATEFAAGLQRAGAAGDADGYDSAFAADVLWGSPFGASVAGWAELNALHHRLMAAEVAPPSRFEVVAALAPTPDVVVTQIRRQATDPDGFSEMAMYVLVERDGRWWLAAAQNTPVGVSPLRSADTDPTPLDQ
ncbi:SgcJ/EcaC family oxidoreductase [Nocardia beijingensis]|uniref:SgcJ/EcaC family oxidoreductase n=1 Tax=Nocardia beijingensis TaxID=95162 RepID=UPI0018955750|nr:nuclear transport factor 2 family protein [Nocardia beijingensis]MBF6467045.1 SgcJ/EcaC family oxidoreductase [Nocardia beijingensis]